MNPSQGSLSGEMKVMLWCQSVGDCRKSTIGFSIGQVLLDFTGGVLSLLQLVLEASVLNDLSLITGELLNFSIHCLARFFAFRPHRTPYRSGFELLVMRVCKLRFCDTPSVGGGSGYKLAAVAIALA